MVHVGPILALASAAAAFVSIPAPAFARRRPAAESQPSHRSYAAAHRTRDSIDFGLCSDVTGFLLKRLALLLPQLLLVVVAAFLLLRLLPVDPVTQRVGIFGTEESRVVVREELGLDGSIGGQLGDFLRGVVVLDFGEAWTTGDPVFDEIAHRFPVTLQLIVIAFTLAILIAIPVALHVAQRAGGKAEKLTTAYALFAGAQPDFWWGLFFIYLFFFVLGLAPPPIGLLDLTLVQPDGPTQFVLLDSLVRGEFEVFISALKHLALPVITLTFVLTGPILKIMRQAAIDVYASDYILYANAAGFSRRRKRRIILRNSLAPTLTVTGILFGFALGGAVIIESVFSLNGMGRYALERTLAVDFPAIQAAVIVMSAFVLVIYLALDLMYALLDPRVKHGARG